MSQIFPVRVKGLLRFSFLFLGVNELLVQSPHTHTILYEVCPGVRICVTNDPSNCLSIRLSVHHIYIVSTFLVYI